MRQPSKSPRRSAVSSYIRASEKGLRGSHLPDSDSGPISFPHEHFSLQWTDFYLRMYMYLCVLIEVSDQFIVCAISLHMSRTEFEDNELELPWLCQICPLLLPLSHFAAWLPARVPNVRSARRSSPSTPARRVWWSSRLRPSVRVRAPWLKSRGSCSVACNKTHKGMRSRCSMVWSTSNSSHVTDSRLCWSADESC
jgi:hypothetical protein